MNVDIQKWAKTSNYKKIGKIQKFLNEEHIFKLQNIIFNHEIYTLENFAIKYISEKKLWEKNYLFRVFASLGYLKSYVEEKLFKNESFSVLGFLVEYENIFKSKVSIFKGKTFSKNDSIDLFPDHSNEVVYKDFIDYLKKHLKEWLKQGNYLNVFNYFVMKVDGDKLSIITTTKGMVIINEKQ